jgi:hypothetical protein
MPEQVCATCGQPRPLELQMQVKSGQVLTMVSCPRCETRTWCADGQQISMDDVLKITSGNPDFVVNPSLRAPKNAPSRR